MGNSILTGAMVNRAMEEKLRQGLAVDVSAFPRTGNHYALDCYADDVDYCDAKTEQWIWSIGRRRSDGAIFASLTTDLYQNPEFECLWLR